MHVCMTVSISRGINLPDLRAKCKFPRSCHSNSRTQQPVYTLRIKMEAHLHSVHTVFSSAVPTILIPASALISIAFGIWLWYRVSAIKVGNGHHGLRTENGREYLLEEEQRGEDEVHFTCACQLLLVERLYLRGICGFSINACWVVQIVQKAADLQDAISEGATSFLITEYKYMGVFMVRIRS